MNIFYVIFSVFILYISIIQCNNIISDISNERAANYCYFCSNCPNPFDPSSAFVTEVYSKTGWCAMITTDDSPYASYTRGIPPGGVCTVNGCSWKTMSGVYTRVCCCNQNLCNGASEPTTTLGPVGNTCYSCSTCPLPFDQHSSYVSEVYSATGWCAKKSLSNAVNAVATRGAAELNLCISSGCTWRIIAEVNTLICCCRDYKCNTGVSTSKSTITMLTTALIIIIMARKSF
ncbi:unnamed protein product [Adineta steineri]|uniref:Uncharacterized protein n=1 Tax=Adineta steineri TaxID=433720 RepID=A0A814W5L9_9BILA|nr:unnamed protein product [Adineta steineri]CAF3533749.1 unnamed protein product [Adineta steineri]